MTSLVTLTTDFGQREPYAAELKGIIHVDRFGNLVSNIHVSDITDCTVRRIEVGDFPIGKLSQSYAEVPQGSPLALLGSSGYLEIAYNGDRADSRLQFGRGIKVRVSLSS